ncbi:MAG: Crp/Fnr family transcriptional regulator [Rhodospirillales bacterium]
MSDGWLDRFPGLAALDEAAKAVLRGKAKLVTLPAGAMPFHQGSACEAFLFVVAGSVRVHMVSETGREIVLYRVEDGQTCILTTCCLMAREDYPAHAVAETEVTAAALPAAVFRELIAGSAAFREMVFSAYGRRVADLMVLVDQVAFHAIDRRLARFLLDRRGPGDRIDATHQHIAVELGTAREVVSRQLKEFERRGWVALGRGCVEVIAVAAVEGLAREQAL